MRRTINLLNSFPVFVILILAGCNTSAHQDGEHLSTASTSPPLKYATLFNIEKSKWGKKMEVYNPWDQNEVYSTYILVHKGNPVPEDIPDNAIVVKTPISNIVTLSSTHIGLLSLLELEHKLVGYSDLRYIYNEKVRKKSQQGEIIEVGKAQNLSLELLIDLKPALVMTSGHEKVHDNLKLLEKAGVPVAYNIEWMENSPLGRTEWLKFMAEFFEKGDLADSIFNTIETQYQLVSEWTKSAKLKPDVLAGSKQKGTWYMPGGFSYTAQFLRDAKASYYWFSDSSRGSLPLSFEEVADHQMTADIWLNPGGFYSLQELIEQDKRYAHFSAFKRGEVYNIHGKTNQNGANDYWESGLVSPHLILKDLIKIIHPELLPDHQLVYYKKLEQQ